ncbi:MAG TPA: hypothetical protein VGN97_03065 [Mesorhizobium sp.]|nr:hypothetical protein [Mesorhizobium sp.]
MSANPTVTIARAFTDTFSGIAPNHVPPFVVTQVIGALAGMALTRWLHQPRPSFEKSGNTIDSASQRA